MIAKAIGTTMTGGRPYAAAVMKCQNGFWLASSESCSWVDLCSIYGGSEWPAHGPRRDVDPPHVCIR